MLFDNVMFLIPWPLLLGTINSVVCSLQTIPSSLESWSESGPIQERPEKGARGRRVPREEGCWEESTGKGRLPEDGGRREEGAGKGGARGGRVLGERGFWGVEGARGGRVLDKKT